MSEVLKALAQMNLKDPNAVPSSEAAHAALLLAHVGWNRALGQKGMDYEVVLKSIEHSRPQIWTELRSRDCESMIEAVQDAKRRLYPDDRRVVLVCGILEDRVHVEWCAEADFPQAARQVARSLMRYAREFGGIVHRETRKKPGA